MKIGPFMRAIGAYNAARNGNAAIEHVLVHTGQHYDDRMSKAFVIVYRIVAGRSSGVVEVRALARNVMGENPRMAQVCITDMSTPCVRAPD
jgi:UDP-N-acetylglucosamine 2-epimerase